MNVLPLQHHHCYSVTCRSPTNEVTYIAHMTGLSSHVPYIPFKGNHQILHVSRDLETSNKYPMNLYIFAGSQDVQWK